MESQIDFKGKFGISDFIDHFGVNKHTWFIFLLLCITMFFEGYDAMIVNYCLPSIQAEWSLDSVVTGSLSSWSLIGLVLGGMFAGPLGDKFGRKIVLTAAIAAFGLLNIPLYFAQNWEVFAVFRVLAGIGLGASIPMVLTSISEWAPSKYRALFVTCAMAGSVLGGVVAGLVGNALCDASVAAAINNGSMVYSETATILLPIVGGLHIDYWRVCFFIGGFPLVYSMISHWLLPETPHFYASRGKLDWCIKQLREYEIRVTGSDSLSRSFSPSQLIVPAQPKKSSPSVLFQKKYLKSTLAVWVAYFCGCMLVYGLTAWLPKMVGALGYSYGLAIIMQAASVFANIGAGVGAETIGRRKNIAIGFSISAAAIAISGVSFLMNAPYAGLAVTMILLGLSIFYGQTSIQPITTEIYPTLIRGTGVSWCEAFGRLGGALAPIVMGIILDSFLKTGAATAQALPMAFFVLVVPAVIAAVVIMVLIKKDYKDTKIEDAGK